MEILRELVPAVTRLAVLVNPASPANAESTLRDVKGAGRAMGLQIQVFDASTSREIDAAFATFVHERPDALFVSSDTFFTSRRVQLVNLATRHAIPTAFANRKSTEIGALMSYGTNIPTARWRLRESSYARRSGGTGIEYPARKSSINCTTPLTRIVSLPTQSKPT